MPLSEEQLKLLILQETQAGTDVDEILLDLLWLKNDGQTLWGQYLVTRIDVINIMLMKNRGLVRFSGDGKSMDLQQEWEHLLYLRDKFIADLSAFTQYGGAPVVCEMEATSPLMGNVGYINPNNGRFYGDITTIQLGYLAPYYNNYLLACPQETE